MAGDDSQRPIIVIKKIKKGGHGHHGGAWKVAYADFVTAMMAFFLLLWLLSSVDENKLKGLAEYFTPTIGLKDSMGIGFEGGEKADVTGVKKSDRSPPGVMPGQTPQGPIPEDPKTAMIESDQDAQLFEKAEENIKKAFEADPNMRDVTENIVVEQSPEGLKIEVMDSDKHPMFDPGSIILTQHGQMILKKIAGLIEDAPNYISVTGHTDAGKMTSRGPDYSNWELSADRANSARRFMEQNGLDRERTKKVVGMASSELLTKDTPTAAKNRRTTIILLRGAYLDLQPSDMPAPRELLSAPKPGERILPATLSDRKKERLERSKERQKEVLAPKPVVVPSLTNGNVPVPKNLTEPKPVDAISTPGAQMGEHPAQSPAPAPAAPAPADTKSTTPPAPSKEHNEEDAKPFMDQ